MCNNGLIAFNRLLSCYPNWKVSSKLRTVRATVFIVCGTWLLCCMLYVIPVMIYRTSWKHDVGCLTLDQYVEEFIEKQIVIKPFDHTPIATIVRFNYAFMTCLTLVVFFACYALIMCKLTSKKQRVTQLSNQRKRNRNRALSVIFAVFMIFILCWIPNMIAVLWRSTVLEQRPLLMCLLRVKAIASPFLYLLTFPALRPQWWQQMQNPVNRLREQSVNKLVRRCNTV